MTPEARREKWLVEGFAALARGGVAAVRVEVIAQRLGVTKGGFYRSFASRRALLDALLESWSAGRIAAIARQAALGGRPPRDRLMALVELYSDKVNPAGMAIELAIRQWAREDSVASEAVAKVDRARLDHVAELYRAMGLSPRAAEAQAFLLYAFIFGQSLIRLEGAARGELLTACADIVIAGGG